MAGGTSSSHVITHRPTAVNEVWQLHLSCSNETYQTTARPFTSRRGAPGTVVFSASIPTFSPDRTQLPEMASDLPAKLRVPAIQPFAIRAAQLENVDAIVSHWCQSMIEPTASGALSGQMTDKL